MNIKCGTDIIEISRIRESIEDDVQESFKKRVFTESEIEYCESKKKQKYQHYAARFAAKEAVFKAISNEIPDKYEISWKDIEVINDETGRPKVNLTGAGINIDNIENIDISISHCKEYAVANVVVVLK